MRLRSTNPGIDPLSIVEPIDNQAAVGTEPNPPTAMRAKSVLRHVRSLPLPPVLPLRLQICDFPDKFSSCLELRVRGKIPGQDRIDPLGSVIADARNESFEFALILGSFTTFATGQRSRVLMSRYVSWGDTSALRMSCSSSGGI